MATGVYTVTEEFEREVSRYTGAPYAVAVDNASNALFMALMYENIKGKEIWIPSRTYMSVPCAIIQAGGIPKFYDTGFENLTGAYRLLETNVIDSALLFTHDMYSWGTMMCLSFTGPHKTLKLPKGGMILTDNPEAYHWFKRARFSGRNEVEYHDDHFDTLGWNFYMLPEIALRGLLLMKQFYNKDGTPKVNPPVSHPYPDLSKYEIYTNPDLHRLSVKEQIAYSQKHHEK